MRTRARKLRSGNRYGSAFKTILNPCGVNDHATRVLCCCAGLISLRGDTYLRRTPAPAQSAFAARVSFIHGGKAQALRFYLHPPLGGGEYFGRGRDPTFADRRVQAARKRRQRLSGDAHVQRQSAGPGPTVGRSGTTFGLMAGQSISRRRVRRRFAQMNPIPGS